ncbi:hypothetical protein C1H46_018436 [Malus baccata]|uniref:Uncharacterized protein n=1 Tax=Malus baccata TaxID=106549 RepID=A0A540MBU1_MALBA|nr:hypothetical protein C1H46_018436 [Malus baccata]
MACNFTALTFLSHLNSLLRISQAPFAVFSFRILGKSSSVISVLKNSPRGAPRAPLRLGAMTNASVLLEWAKGFAGAA